MECLPGMYFSMIFMGIETFMENLLITFQDTDILFYGTTAGVNYSSVI